MDERLRRTAKEARVALHGLPRMLKLSSVPAHDLASTSVDHSECSSEELSPEPQVTSSRRSAARAGVGACARLA